MSKFKELFESLLAEFNLFEATEAETLRTRVIGYLKGKLTRQYTIGKKATSMDKASAYFTLTLFANDPLLKLNVPVQVRIRCSNHTKPEIYYKQEAADDKEAVDVYVPSLAAINELKLKHTKMISDKIRFYKLDPNDNERLEVYTRYMLIDVRVVFNDKFRYLKDNLIKIKDNKNTLDSMIDSHDFNDRNPIMRLYNDLYGDYWEDEKGNKHYWFQDWYKTLGKEPAQQSKADEYRRATADIQNTNRPTLTLGGLKSKEY